MSSSPHWDRWVFPAFHLNRLGLNLYFFKSCRSDMASSSSSHIGIIGSGLIGKSWAMIFASVGYKVGLPSVFVQPTFVNRFIASIGNKVGGHQS